MSTLEDSLKRLREVEESVKPRIEEIERKEAEENEREVINLMNIFTDKLRENPRIKTIEIYKSTANSMIAVQLKRVMSDIYPNIDISVAEDPYKRGEMFYRVTKFRE